MVLKMNLGNPSILIAMDYAKTGWVYNSFFMPCATVCNAKYLSWLKIAFLLVFTPFSRILRG